MAYVRLALMTPKRGSDARVAQLLDELAALHRTQPGFIAEYILNPAEHQTGEGRVGRIAVWESEDAARRVAALERDVAIQSQLKLEVDDVTHVENSFSAEATARG